MTLPPRPYRPCAARAVTGTSTRSARRQQAGAALSRTQPSARHRLWGRLQAGQFACLLVSTNPPLSHNNPSGRAGRQTPPTTNPPYLRFARRAPPRTVTCLATAIIVAGACSLMAQIGAVVVTARPASGPGRQRLVSASRSRETVGAPGGGGAARSLWSRGRPVVHTARAAATLGLERAPMLGACGGRG